MNSAFFIDSFTEPPERKAVDPQLRTILLETGEGEYLVVSNGPQNYVLLLDETCTNISMPTIRK